MEIFKIGSTVLCLGKHTITIVSDGGVRRVNIEDIEVPYVNICSDKDSGVGFSVSNGGYDWFFETSAKQAAEIYQALAQVWSKR